MIKTPCKSCAGSGRTRQEKKLAVSIPAGVEDGTRIRLSGEGEAGARGAPPGDLYVFLGLDRHELFQREGANLYCRVPVPMTTAALGGDIEVPAIDGNPAKVEVKAGTQPGHRERLRGRGMSILRNTNRGDLYVEIAVETPTHMTKKQKEIMAEFAKESGEKAFPESRGFWERIRAGKK